MLLEILVALDNRALQRRLKRLFNTYDAQVDFVQSRDQMWRHLTHRSSSLVLVGRSLLNDDAAEMIASIRSLPDGPEVIVVCDEENPEERAELIGQGCFAVLYSGLSNDGLQAVLATIIERRWESVTQLLTGPQANKPRLGDFASASPRMVEFMNVVRRVMAADTTLLILGETGVGKEWLARGIHAESRRSAGPFIAVNCGALAESLLESELFGHEEGAFTGATRSRRGCFELAHHGTLFLDEIGEMPFHLQSKLLRVLQERELQRVGSERCIRLNVRVMAASNRDLEADTEQGRFRKDLFYRLSVVTLNIPPLRERSADIPDLVASYVRSFRTQIPTRVEGIESEAQAILAQYHWPGNVRELINVVERAVLLCQGALITPDDLPESIKANRQPSLPSVPDSPLDGPDWLDRPLQTIRDAALDNVERQYLSGWLRRTGGSIGETARHAGITPRALFNKMKRLGLQKESFRSRGNETSEHH